MKNVPHKAPLNFGVFLVIAYLQQYEIGDCGNM
jgi:hypothetical protein